MQNVSQSIFANLKITMRKSFSRHILLIDDGFQGTGKLAVAIIGGNSFGLAIYGHFLDSPQHP